MDPLSILGIIIVTNNVSLSLRHKFYPRSYTKHFSLSYSPILTHTDQLSHLLCSFFLTPSTHFTNCIFSLNHNTTLKNLSLTYPLVNTHTQCKSDKTEIIKHIEKQGKHKRNIYKDINSIETKMKNIETA